jgi:hypothetical protein
MIELVVPSNWSISSINRILTTRHLLLADGLRLINVTNVTESLRLPTLPHTNALILPST